MVRAAWVRGPGIVEIVEREPRALADGEVRLRVEAVGVCGSDVALMAGRHPYAVYPVTPGHELGARVLEGGREAPLAAGQRVTVRPLVTCGQCRACREGRLNHCPDVRVLGVHLDGGMADEIIVPASTVFTVPDDMPAERAAMVEPTAVAVHLANRAGIGRGTTLAIIGTGVIGLLALQVARAWGARAILAVDRVPERLALAEQLGAHRVVDNRTQDAAREGNDMCPDGFDVVLDLVGTSATLASAQELARRGGTLVLVALPHRPVTFDFEPLYRKELTLCGTRLYAGDFADAIPLVASGRVAVDALITHRFPLDQAARALSLAGEAPAEAIKVIVNP
ncbi:MAG TPA: zinc-binding dehydrogenase [Anaerolineales bacterium]|nr:zinc-binding dehydrogenase [Anaerolineales bacterium]